MSTLHHTRITSARAALRRFVEIKSLGRCKLTEPDYESDLSDLICDLCHLANHKGFSPSTILRRAESQYEFEHDERQEAARKHGRHVKGSNGHWLDAVHDQAEHDKHLPDTEESDREFPDALAKP